jgi:hypothetical protein
MILIGLVFLASFEFIADIKGWEDVNKLCKTGGRKTYKNKEPSILKQIHCGTVWGREIAILPH